MIALTLTELLPDGETLATGLGRVMVTILVAWLVQRVAFVLVGRAERWLVRAAEERPHGQQRARTLGQIARHLITAVVIGAVVIHVLEIAGWDVRPLLVGASILGAALGFGAQWLVRDVIAGAFILVEDQFAVGDVVETNGLTATVEDVSLRATRLRDFRGRLLFVPNGEMKIVMNHSRGWTRQVVDVPVAADQDLDRALAQVRVAAQELNADVAWRSRLLEPVEFVGIERLAADGATVRLTLRAMPGADGPEAARELRRRALHRLAAAGIRTGSGRDLAAVPTAPPSAEAGERD